MRGLRNFARYLLLALLAALCANVAAAAPKIRTVDFSSQQEVVELKAALTPYHAPGVPETDGSRWYAVTITNNAPRAVTRILQAGPWPSIALRIFPASTRP
jgi:hypothetical protein